MGKVTDSFKKRTQEMFRPIEGIYSVEDIEQLALTHVTNLLDDAGCERASVTGVVVFGSRSRGKENSESDIDIVVGLADTGWSEDFLFNLLNDNEHRLFVEGIPVDINPITPEKSGTLDEFLARTASLYEERGWI